LKYHWANKNQKGFSILELVVAISIFTVLLFVAVYLFQSIFTSPKQQISAMDNIDRARIVLSGFTNEIRNAANGKDGSYPLNEASDGEIIFFTNFGAQGSVNRIRYYIDDNILYKGIIEPAGNPPVYNVLSETVSPVLSGVSDGFFSYYNGDYNGQTDSLLQPVNINQVKFIKMNLSVSGQTVSEDGGLVSVAAGATMRTLKDNLGN